jgi:glycerophosphoryl diester phosphodiesterase
MSVHADHPLVLPPPPWVVGHRGAAGVELENSLAAIATAVTEGVQMIEVDVQLTGDGVPVLFHDWDLRRLAGRSEIVERTEASELREIPLPNPFGQESRHIPSLEEALADLPLDFPVNLELKRRFHDPREVATTLARILDQNRSLLISSFDWNLLAEIRRSLPQVAVAPLGRWKADELLAAAEQLDAFSVHAHHELAPELLARAHRPVLAYTVNDPLEARRLFDLGVVGVFTDTPGTINSALATG